MIYGVNKLVKYQNISSQELTFFDDIFECECRKGCPWQLYDFLGL